MTVVEHEVLAPAEILTDAERRARTLEAAALEIEVRGWHQGDLGGEEGVCLIAGICHAEGGWDGWVQFSDHVESPHQFAGRVFGCDHKELYRFNDAPGRTAEDVTAHLRSRASEIRRGA